LRYLLRVLLLETQDNYKGGRKMLSSISFKMKLLFFAIPTLTFILFLFTKKSWGKLKKYKGIFKWSNDSVYCGKDQKGNQIYISTKQRSMHTQVIGTTNAGKTESVILPWAIQDIEQGRGLILIDGKSDESLLKKLMAYTEKIGRMKDFRLVSLAYPGKSHSFNPLLGGTPEEITERVFNSFEIENPYYRSLQYEVFGQVMRIFADQKIVPTFKGILEVLTYDEKLSLIAMKCNDQSLADWAKNFCALKGQERELRTSGLKSMISHFCYGESAKIFNVENSLTLDESLSKNLIVYFQLPVLLSPFLGKAMGKLVLQCLQSAISKRHLDKSKVHKFFSVMLDDFTEYLYPGFVSILNKSRSANVGVVFAHQSLGDLKVLGDPIANSILTNSNLKIFMRGNDPDSAEYFSKVIGTIASNKQTHREKSGIMGREKTGDISTRDVEEFSVHPNIFKKELGVGEAVMVVPHDFGSSFLRIKFHKLDDLPFDVQAMDFSTKGDL
jgi:conjugal transfer pilus assembly protein TraD